MSAAATTQPSSSVSVAIQSADGLRLEDAALLTGRGEFADDLPTSQGRSTPPSCARSMHARIRSVDMKAVLACRACVLCSPPPMFGAGRGRWGLR